MATHYYNIARHLIRINMMTSEHNDWNLLPSFTPFLCSSTPQSPCTTMLELTIDDTLKSRKDKQLIRSFDTGNGDTVVYQLSDGGYQMIVKNAGGAPCCMLQSDASMHTYHCALNGTWTMRSFGLNNALMMAYAFAGASHDTLLIHASCVMHKGYGYPFIAKSGTGKSTHSALWLNHISDTQLLNDDNPVIRVIQGKSYLFGSPWSGKTPCYRNRCVPLGAVTRIDRASENSIEQLPPVQAFASMLPSCSTMKWDSMIYNKICDTISAIIANTPIYILHCLPDKQAALLCHKTITT